MSLPFNPFPIDLNRALDAFEEMEQVLNHKLAKTTVPTMASDCRQRLLSQWDALVLLAQAGMREAVTVSLQAYGETFARELALKVKQELADPDVLRLRFSTKKRATLREILKAAHQEWSANLLGHVRDFETRHVEHLQQALLASHRDARLSLQVATSSTARGTGSVQAAPAPVPYPPQKPLSPVVWVLLVVVVGFVFLGFGMTIFLGMLLHP